ncbi:MAG: carbon storage regulator [Gemmataceae bacterium]
MLVLTRKTGQSIHIGSHVKITVVKLNGGTVRIGIDAPEDISILRGELTHWLLEEPEEPMLQCEETTTAFPVLQNDGHSL